MNAAITILLIVAFIEVGCELPGSPDARSRDVCVPSTETDFETATLGATQYLPLLLGKQDHYALTVAPDLRQLFVTRGLVDGGGVFELALIDGAWTQPRSVQGLRGEFNDNDLFISPDGTTGFFMSSRPLRAGDSKQVEQDLWMMHRAGGSWSAPIHLGDAVNSPARDGYPSVATGGVLYFFSERDGGRGSSDIYRSRRTGKTYGEAENLGGVVNSDAWDGLPYIAPDESFLIFFSTRAGGYGDGDLYVSYNEGGEWSFPENLGPLVNSPLSDLTPHISPDGRCLFLSRPSGADNRRIIYVIPVDQTPIRIDRARFARAVAAL